MSLQHDVVCPTVIGRDQQLAALRQVLARASEGSGRVALIVGEAGVGKSRLLRAMTDEARGAGFFALHGASFEAERSIPYAPLLDLVRLFAASASPAIVAHVLAPVAADLVGIFPELRMFLPGAEPSPTIDPESDRRRLFNGLTHVTTQLARTQPVFLAFEDVHWSDDATLELIFHLARGHVAQRVVIALTYRGEEAGPRLTRLVTDLERARLIDELPLERLGRTEVAAMLQAIFGTHENLGPEFVHLLHGLTEGNPFFVEETLKALIIAGDLTPTSSGGWRARPLERVRVPRTAVEAVRRRLAALTAAARAVASTAAVAGRRFDFGLLQTLTGHDEQEMLALVKELITAQLVVEESAERFAFRHALTREAIYAELLTRERVALHREVAAAIEQHHAASLDPVIEALAYHTWEAGDWQRAAAHSARAAEHALALSEPRQAVAHLDRAFAASERAGVTPGVDLYLARGRANETLGEFQRAHDDFTTALERARAASNLRGAWDALYALGMLWSARDYARAGEYRRDALAVSRSLGDEVLVARSLNRVGNWHVNLEQPQAGLPHHEEALAIFERLDDRRKLANALGLLALCGPSYQSSATTPFSSPVGEEELRTLRSVGLAHEIGWRAGETFLRFIIADCLVGRGEYDRALPLAREALAQAQEIEHREWTAGALRVLGAMSLDLLAPNVAREHLEAAYRIAQRLGSRVWMRWTAAPLAVARARMSDLSGALEVWNSAARLTEQEDGVLVGGDPSASTQTLGEGQLWAVRAELALIEGRPELALEIVDARLAAERAANPDSVLGVPRLSLLRADALTTLGQYDDAERTLDAAREEATVQEAPQLLWRIELAVGHVHRLQRRRLEARRAFDAARAIADTLAAKVPDDALRTRFVEKLDSAIPSTPSPTASRAAKRALGGLTRRERDVAELVAVGKSNRVIGRELGIGERTVEGYVANALSKLGFTSRTQLAAWAVEMGITIPRPPAARTSR